MYQSVPLRKDQSRGEPLTYLSVLKHINGLLLNGKELETRKIRIHCVDK